MTYLKNAGVVKKIVSSLVGKNNEGKMFPKKLKFRKCFLFVESKTNSEISKSKRNRKQKTKKNKTKIDLFWHLKKYGFKMSK